MSEPYRFLASTTGVWGHITRPFNEIIPVQASLALPGTGGFGTARADRFDFRGILSFESAAALVSGSYNETNRTFDSTATVTITGLNILSMVTADRVVATIATESPEDPAQPPSITPIGSYFENLRIAGHLVRLDLATDTFHKHATLQGAREAYKSDQQFQQEFDKLTLAGRNDLSDIVRRHAPWFGKRGIAGPGQTTVCSLVREIEGLPNSLRPEGHVIYVRGFGVIRLAEFRITDNTRTITMLQVDMGSDPSGPTGGGGTTGGGSPTG
jgi:hypothetical protein